jgi:hypothetical protein
MPIAWMSWSLIREACVTVQIRPCDRTHDLGTLCLAFFPSIQPKIVCFVFGYGCELGHL